MLNVIMLFLSGKGKNKGKPQCTFGASKAWQLAFNIYIEMSYTTYDSGTAMQ